MKKVFISYSWGTKEHQDWVQNIGTRLMNDGVEVTLDRWSVKPGHDLNFYMESMVKKDVYDKVLIVSDKNYSEKADGRNGGVGTEVQIITPEIYGNVKQEKFLPLVVEKDEEDNPYLPIFLKSKLYFDFSKEEYFEEEYENLLRNIYDAPQIIKPKLGTPPSYITEQQSIFSNKSDFFLRSFENQLQKNPLKINSLSRDFIEIIKEDLYEYRLNFGGGYSIKEAGKETVDILLEYKKLRKNIISFFLIVTKVEYNVDYDIIKNLFESKNMYQRPKDKSLNSWYESDFQHYKFIFHELFIYLIASCIKNQNYRLLNDLLYTPYFYSNNYGEKLEPKSFSEIRSNSEILNNYYKEEYRKITGIGDFMITNLSEKINKNLFVQADLLLHYIDEIDNTYNSYFKWFPITFLYKDENYSQEIFLKLTSVRHFEKTKIIFDVETVSELKSKLTSYKQDNENKSRQNLRFPDNPWNYVPFIYEIIEIEKIGIFK
jgi:hypothetical protein